MFGDGFEQSMILRTGPDGLTRVITRSSWHERESILVEAHDAERVVLRRWSDFHEQALGFPLPGAQPIARLVAYRSRLLRSGCLVEAVEGSWAHFRATLPWSSSQRLMGILVRSGENLP